MKNNLFLCEMHIQQMSIALQASVIALFARWVYIIAHFLTLKAPFEHDEATHCFIYCKEVGCCPLEMPLGVLDSSSWIGFVNRRQSKWDLVLSLFLITRRLKTLITGCGNTQRESKQNAQHILLYISHYYCICSICSHFLCHCWIIQILAFAGWERLMHI